MRSVAILSVVLLVVHINADPIQSREDPKVKAAIYYHVFDKSSIELFRAQNRTGVWELMLPESTELAIDFNPMGKATETNGAYDCGDDKDCHATKLQACAIKNHQNDELTHHQIFHFIVCTAIHDDWQTKPDTVVTQCITEVAEWPGDAESIEICSKDSEQANKFLGEFLSAAQEQKVNKVPWVTIDGKRNEKAESDLLAGVCGAFKEGEKPKECGKDGDGDGDGNDGSSAAAQLFGSKVLAISLLVLAVFGFKSYFIY